MSNFISNEQKIKDLVDYYKENGLSIIGLNDSQGVPVTSTFFKKGLLEYLANTLTTWELEPTVINAFSLLMNKTEHIDYFLSSNLSVEEIKLSQTYSAVSALKKVMSDLHLPKCLGNVGYIYKLIYAPEKADRYIHISDVLRESVEPVVIYSSGVNNLMREVGNNPFSIRSDYNARTKRPNYDYTLRKTTDPSTLNKVLEGIEGNFESILSINSYADIYALGAYVPMSLEKEGMNIFRDLVLSYNERLQNLCSNYHVTYINTEAIGQAFVNGESNFHISSAGHNSLANHILGHMYENKIGNPVFGKNNGNKILMVSNGGSKAVLNSTLSDYDRTVENVESLTGYDKKRELEIAKEHEREAKVFKKVMDKIVKR